MDGQKFNAEVERYAAELRGQVVLSRDYVRLEGRLGRMEIDARIASDEIRRLREENARLRAERDTNQAELIQRNGYVLKLTRERDEARAEVSRLKADLLYEQERNRNNVAQYSEQVKLLDQAATDYRKSRDAAEKRVEELEQERGAVLPKMAAKNDEIDRLTLRVEELERALAEVYGVMAEGYAMVPSQRWTAAIDHARAALAAEKGE